VGWRTQFGICRPSQYDRRVSPDDDSTDSLSVESHTTGAIPTARGHLTAAAYTGLAVLAATAVARLYAYRIGARIGGAYIPRAVGSLQQWCRRAWPRLRLDVQTLGTPLAQPCVYVANHRSYLDIVVLSGALGATFLSRADIASWPFIGAVAKEIGAVFVERDDMRGRVRAARELRRRARTCSIIVFPEGTTCGERLPTEFHPGLFRLLARLGVPVVPVTVRYGDRRAYWTENITVWQHLRTQIISKATLQVAVHIAPTLPHEPHDDGTRLRQAAYTAVCEPIAALGELVCRID